MKSDSFIHVSRSMIRMTNSFNSYTVLAMTNGKIMFSNGEENNKYDCRLLFVLIYRRRKRNLLWRTTITTSLQCRPILRKPFDWECRKMKWKEARQEPKKSSAQQKKKKKYRKLLLVDQIACNEFFFSLPRVVFFVHFFFFLMFKRQMTTFCVFRPFFFLSFFCCWFLNTLLAIKITCSFRVKWIIIKWEMLKCCFHECWRLVCDHQFDFVAISVRRWWVSHRISQVPNEKLNILSLFHCALFLDTRATFICRKWLLIE